MHYRMATKNDTLFWKEIKEKPIPDKILLMYNTVIDSPPDKEEFFNMLKRAVTKLGNEGPGRAIRQASKLPVFGAHHWWQLLKGCGRYENIKKVYSEDFIKYSKLALNVSSNRIDNVLNIFPNHYDYLTEWYEG